MANVEAGSGRVYDVGGEKLYDRRREHLAEPLPPKHPSFAAHARRLAELPKPPIDLIRGGAAFAGVAYTGWSHVWAKSGSWRVVLFPPGGPFTVRQWRFMWDLCFDVLGGEHCGLDPACKDPNRLYFLPRLSSLARELGLPTPYATRRWGAPQSPLPDRSVLLSAWKNTPKTVKRRGRRGPKRPPPRHALPASWAQSAVSGALLVELDALDADCGYWQWFRTACAVSYTHLRAHETGLALVCRLPLE